MARGIAKGRLFEDDFDRTHFHRRLKKAVLDSRLRCYAWAFLPNHIHLLFETGPIPLWHPMQKLLTEYAGWFNHRHGRVGHLFQNRYKAVLCDADSYLLELVRYIHLNPVRAGIVNSLTALQSFRWSGHAALLSDGRTSWQDTERILSRFAESPSRARSAYCGFMADGLTMDHKGRSLFDPFARRAPGPAASPSASRSDESCKSDPRILGSSTFVSRVMTEVGSANRRRASVRRFSPDEVLRYAAKSCGIEVDDLKRPNKRPAVSAGRALACNWLASDLGMKGTEVAHMLGISESAVSQAACRGRALAAKRNLRLGES